MQSKLLKLNKEKSTRLPARRDFLKKAGLGAVALGLSQFGCRGQRVEGPAITDFVEVQGFEEETEVRDPSYGWEPVSDRKIRVGIVGIFGATFGFQDHPNVELVGISDLIPERRDRLAEATRCKKTYASLEEMVKDDSIEAVFIGTDAPSHARHTLEVLRHGKHAAVAVPAIFGELEDADRLVEEVKRSGLKYMMFETSNYRANLFAMHRIYNARGFGKLVYTEGEYYHYFGEPYPSYKDWRVGLPPQWYPTHSNAYYIGVTNGYFTEVSCLGFPSIVTHLQAENNIYKNPFGTEIAMFRTGEGGMARMAVSWDTPGFGVETGRCRGQRGSFTEKYQGLEKELPCINRPPLPPGVRPGGHGGSHGHLTNEFILSILEDRDPWIDINMSLNMTVPGIIAHKSALKGGEWMKIPRYV